MERYDVRIDVIVNKFVEENLPEIEKSRKKMLIDMIADRIREAYYTGCKDGQLDS